MISKKALIAGGSDGHGAACAVSSSEYLKRNKWKTEIFAKFPDTGNPFVFWEKTLEKLELSNFDLLLILDIPPIKDNPNKCFDKLREISKKMEVLYIDHHKINGLKEIPKFVKIVSNAFECCLGKPDYVMRIGAICDRDDNILPVKKEEVEIAGGLDAAVRKDIKKAIRHLKIQDYEYFRKMAFEIPFPEVLEKTADILITDLTNLQTGWKFKSLERAIQHNNSDYGIGIIAHSDIYEIIVIKDWMKKEKSSVEEIIQKNFFNNLSDEIRYCYGHKNAMVFKITKQRELLENFLLKFKDFDYSQYLSNIC